MKSEKSLWQNNFSHIYIEKNALNFKYTHEILSKLKNSNTIIIDDYMDFFSSSNQSFAAQKNSRKLILAVKKDNFLYAGADVCENFGYDNFYYTTNVINCIFDCEYCFLQGVYNSANIVVFVNVENLFHEVKKMSSKEKIYICISYNTDLLALDNLLNLIEKWYNLVKENENLTVELRTKSSNYKIFKKFQPVDRFIIAYTISPQEIIDLSERGTANLNSRINSLEELSNVGMTIRICFDPLIYTKNFKKIYEALIDKIFTSNIKIENIKDVSIGVFRISKSYIKRIREQNKNSLLLSYPFVNEDGVYTYDELLRKEMIETVRQKVLKYLPPEKIFI